MNDINTYLNGLQNEAQHLQSKYHQTAVRNMVTKAEGLLRVLKQHLGNEYPRPPTQSIEAIEEILPFKCPHCEYRARTEQGINSHRGKKHKIRV